MKAAERRARELIDALMAAGLTREDIAAELDKRGVPPKPAPGDRYIAKVKAVEEIAALDLPVDEWESEFRRRGLVKTGPRGGRAKDAPESPEAELMDGMVGAARIFAEDHVKRERAAVVAALRAWAEDGGDPWMSHCADRIAAGEHLTRTGDL